MQRLTLALALLFTALASPAHAMNYGDGDRESDNVIDERPACYRPETVKGQRVCVVYSYAGHVLGYKPDCESMRSYPRCR